eukprot:m.33478 g.33478  ORF g.33478 m.33478 type:complete len:494 (+) comp5026_c0_seq1:141-1622(+)
MGKRRATPEAGPAVESGTTEQKTKGRTSTAQMDDATPTKPYTFAAGAFNKTGTVADAEIGSLFTGDAVAPVRLAPTAAGGSTPRGSKRRKVGAGAAASMAEGVVGGAGVDDDEDRVIRRGSKADKSRNLRTVFVGNLAAKTKTGAVRRLFSEFGQIESVRFRSLSMSQFEGHEGTVTRAQLVKTRQSQTESSQSAINAYVVFASQDAAKAALVRNGTLHNERHLRVDIAANAKKHDPTTAVFIGNLALDVTDEDLWTAFSDCGRIANVRVIRDPLTGVGKGIGFVTFVERSSVATALYKSGTPLRGRNMRVARYGHGGATGNSPSKSKGKSGGRRPASTTAAAASSTSASKGSGANPRKRDADGRKRRWSRVGPPTKSPSHSTSGDTKQGAASSKKQKQSKKRKSFKSGHDVSSADNGTGFSGLQAVPGVLPEWVKNAGKASGASNASRKEAKAHKKELRNSKKAKAAARKAKEVAGAADAKKGTKRTPTTIY